VRDSAGGGGGKGAKGEVGDVGSSSSSLARLCRRGGRRGGGEGDEDEDGDGLVSSPEAERIGPSFFLMGSTSYRYLLGDAVGSGSELTRTRIRHSGRR
jgi:hypothetical protein